jgi:hypothetical protein
VEGLAHCVTAGRSASRDPRADAGLVWTALHGVVSLRSAGPQLPWPDLDAQVAALVTRLALLEPGRSTGDQAG